VAVCGCFSDYDGPNVSEEFDHSTLRIRRTPNHEAAERIGDDAQVVVLVGHAIGRRYAIGEQLELGRGPTSPVEILDDGVSRRHAVIERCEDGRYSLRDLGSRNGTFVNGERIEVSELAYGDRIAVGSRTVLLFASRDRFEDQRIQAQKMQALGQLAGGIAHDFNNLLGVVLANVTHVLSLREFEDAMVRRTLAEVETAARRAVDLTNQLLAFARSGQRRHEPVGIVDTVRDANRLLRRTLHRSIEIQAEASPGVAVVGDPSQLLQVLMNLCINAGDAMPEGGRLTIEADHVRLEPADIAEDDTHTPGEYVRIRVRDEGIGMTQEIRDRIFEPFFTTKPRGKGTGLGLATAHAIVRDHGGHIAVETEPGVGTTFEVLLPAASEPPEVGPRGTDEMPTPLRGVVLLADDEELVRAATGRVLRHAGLEVLPAHDGQHALDVYAANADRIDLVLLDLDMPQLNGEQVYARLHALMPALRVIISSGYLDSEREATLRQAGVDGILYKPYDSLTLMQAVAKVLGRANREIER
jgi:signal transduction histidine kinase/CheY-like chemotaxis protein